MDPQSQAQLQSLQRRRAVLDALMGQSLQPRQTQFAGRLAVPVTPLQGLTQIASAFLAKRGSDRLDKQETEITSGYQSRLGDAYKRIAAALNPQQQPQMQPMPQMPDPANFPGVDPSLLTVPEGVGRRMTQIPGGGFYGNAPNVPNDMAIQSTPIGEFDTTPVEVNAPRPQPQQQRQQMDLQGYLQRVTDVSRETGIPLETLMASPVVKAQIEALQKQAEPFTLGEGQKRFVGGDVVAEGGQKLTDIEQLAAGYQRAMEAKDFATARAIEAEMASKGLSNIMKDEYTGKVYAMKGNELIELGKLTAKPEGTTEVYDPTSPSQTRLVKDSEAIGQPGAAKVKATSVTTNVNTGDNFKNEQSLKDDFTKDSKAFVDVRDGYTRMKSALENPEITAASTLAGATAFMKLLDPGSVVRESELGMALAASGAIDRALNYFNILQKGKVLTESQRQDFLNIGRQLYEAAEANQATLENQYRQDAAAYGLNPERVVKDFRIKSATEGKKADPNIKILRREGG